MRSMLVVVVVVTMVIGHGGESSVSNGVKMEE